jgi:hypothetical protein
MPDEHSLRARRYANCLEVSFSADDFVLDFGQQFNDQETVQHTGIVATPRSIDAFVEILTRSLAEHRRRYGAGRTEPEA